jgi:EIX receptor 1/2
MCHQSFLQTLDLSKNNIIGQIPQCFRQIVALSNLKFPRKILYHSSFTLGYVGNEEVYEVGSFNDKEIFSSKGYNREYDRNLGLMTTIDLSCNQLIGEIRQSITKLVVLASLNLSGKNLTGLIAKNIGHMKMSESLDLSRKHISGRMPTSFP